MATEILKILKGHSGSHVYLMKNDEGTYIRKDNYVQRNIERMQALHGVVPLPKILKTYGDTLEMEYIQGEDMRTYLINNIPDHLSFFLDDVLTTFRMRTIGMKDYTESYEKALDWMAYSNPFPFSKHELIDKLPKVLPQSPYHGDLTLENIIHSKKFYLIDPVTVPYDSYYFDVAKLRQDLDCGWFLRDNPALLDAKLQQIKRRVGYSFAEPMQDDYILILMLLRVHTHCLPNTTEQEFIMREVNRLWK